MSDSGIDNCTADPCTKHGVCHCSCVCFPDGPDNCATCQADFDEPKPFGGISTLMFGRGAHRAFANLPKLNWV